MKIQNINQSQNQKFNGIKIASARVKLEGYAINYDLYKITSKDNLYLDSLAKNINLHSLWPGLSKRDYFLWGQSLFGLLDFAKIDSKESILIAKDGVPCGGINSSVKNNTCEVGYRVTWPYEKDNKAPFAGKILYLQLFKKCLDEGVRGIKTTVTRLGPFNPVTKCYELGFSSNGGDNFTEDMCIGRKSMSRAIDKFREYVEITPVPEDEQEDKDLFEVLK